MAEAPKKTCPRCKGKGWLDAKFAPAMCLKCNGSGKVPKEGQHQ